MMRGAYYNEIDPFAAAWLRELIKAGHIAPGDVDERSIADVRPADLDGYAQCHFFAGVGVWSYALRRAGWTDDRSVWTGSCPCQPFSDAGKGGGFDDERHLWPEFYRLIAERRPAIVLGEQVASKDGLAWLDLVSADLESSDYAFGAVDLCAAGVGAPHIRQRLWWVAQGLDDATGTRHVRAVEGPEGITRDEARLRLPGEGSGHGRMADADEQGSSGRRIQGPGQSDGASLGAACERPSGLRADGWVAIANDTERRTEATGGDNSDRAHAGRTQSASDAEGRGGIDGTANAHVDRQPPRRLSVRPWRQDESAAIEQRDGKDVQPGPVNGLWRASDWLFCRDGKWRPVEPGTFPLAHGAPCRVGRLRGYGNAVNAEAATEFVETVMESIDARIAT